MRARYPPGVSGVVYRLVFRLPPR